MTKREHGRRDIELIFRAAIAGADASTLVARALSGETPGASFIAPMVWEAARIFVVAVGKASPAMADALTARLRDRVVTGLVVTLPGLTASTVTRERLQIVESSHPLPSEASVKAGRAALEMLSEVRAGDLAIVALSGGASAMLAMPAEGVTLADKLAVSRELYRSGASIGELNAVRKHLSEVKGGGLARAARGGRVLGLILSDVPGNDLSTIGSGPTAPDPTTYADAIGVLKRRRLWGRAPESVRERLERGNAGDIAETAKTSDPIFSRVTNVIVGDNATALEAAGQAARQAGYEIERWRELRGEANDVGRSLAAHLWALAGKRLCVLAGGEPVVTVKGPGRGGRAQQAALAMAIELSRIAADLKVAAMFAGTDGIDGPTDAAGAFAFPDTVARAKAMKLDASSALRQNDSYNLFAALGDLLISGATGTNVGDVFIGLTDY